MGIKEEGIKAEQWILKELRKRNIICFQPDALSLENGNWVLNEVKNQELFEPPPFFGQGLPRWQINARMFFWRLTGIRCRLIIMDKKSGEIYWQWLDILEEGKMHDTWGKKPRRIYPIENFKKW